MTNLSTITQIRSYLAQINNLLSILALDNTPPNYPPITQPPNAVQSCVLISHIVCEKNGAIKDNVVLTVKDFNILKQNVHVFTVIPAVPPTVNAVPTISIHDLQAWIVANSITKVPPVPTDNV